MIVLIIWYRVEGENAGDDTPVLAPANASDGTGTNSPVSAQPPSPALLLVMGMRTKTMSW